MFKTILFTTVLLLLPALPAQAEDWPTFRGAHTDGVVSGAGVFSDRNGCGLTTRWSVPLGSGYSGPVVERHGFRVERSLTSEGPGWTGWRNRLDDVLERLYPAEGSGG